MLPHNHQNTSKKLTIPFADKRGNFYCRSIHGILDTKKDQHVCGIGCPYYEEMAEKDQIRCGFLEQWKENNERSSEIGVEEIQQAVQSEIEQGKQHLFPDVKGMDSTLLQAYQYAASAHREQYRKGTDIPYFTHLITTMNYAMLLTTQTDILVAAVLHDTVEDTRVSIEDIKKCFGAHIADYIAQETENKRNGQPAADTWEIRKQENICHLQQASKEVKMIVLSDKTANAESMVRECRVYGDAVWSKFNQKDKKKQAWYYRSCQRALQEFTDTETMRYYGNYLDELFGKE